MNSLYDNEIALHAEPEEEDRILRLNRVIGFVFCANNDILEKVESLKDHKGFLTVKWLIKPTDNEKQILLNAGASGIGDGSNNVNHEIVL